MKLPADEIIDQSIVDALRAKRHEVRYVADQAPGFTDEQVIAAAVEQEALLLTSDKDFGELVFRQIRISKGALLIRLAGLASEAKGILTSGVLDEHGDELIGRFSVLTPRALRIRSLVDSG